MTMAWIFVLVTLMAGSRAGKKIKRSKDKRIIGRFTAGDFGVSNSEDTIDWDALSSDDDEVEGPIIKEEEEETGGPSAPTITYTRRKSVRRGGVRFNESVLSPQWGHQETLRIGDLPAPTQPSTTHEGESSQPTSNLESIQREHQRLMNEQVKLDQKLEEVRAELKDVKKKQNSISRMVKKMDLTMSDESDSD